MQEDRYKPFVLAPLEVIGIDSFDEGGVRLKMRIKTAPQKQWDLGRELRRRIMRALSERGIQMFSAQRTDLAAAAAQYPAVVGAAFCPWDS